MLLNILQVIVTVTLAAAGWWIGYLTTLRRDRVAKQRDLRTQYLVEAYRRLESASNRKNMGSGEYKSIESALADIQLLGTPSQVRLAKTFATAFATERGASLDELLFDLRADLRQELHLPPVADKISFLRIV